MDREEAIEIIRKNMPSDKSLPVYEALQTLVPELVESEDEKIRQFLLRLVKRCPESSIDFMGEIKKGDVIAWLEKQKEQKWGEDDEKMLARIIERGQSRIQMFETGLLPEHIDWLKSLRPSWKPSEEQMKALHRCIYYLRSDGSEYFEPIKSLYEQLNNRVRYGKSVDELMA